MGLAAHWLRVVETIGFDAFDALWRILDAETRLFTDDGQITLSMRPYRSYLRFQRNRWIEQLWRSGRSPQDIRDAVMRELGEDISLRHISRIVSGK